MVSSPRQSERKTAFNYEYFYFPLHIGTSQLAGRFYVSLQEHIYGFLILIVLRRVKHQWIEESPRHQNTNPQITPSSPKWNSEGRLGCPGRTHPAASEDGQFLNIPFYLILKEKISVSEQYLHPPTLFPVKGRRGQRLPIRAARSAKREKKRGRKKS